MSTSKPLRFPQIHKVLPDFELPAHVWVITAVWLLAMILLPILDWIWGETALRQGVILGVLLQAAAVLLILKTKWRWSRIVRIAATIAIITFGVEFIGSRTGLPFGHYHYTAFLQPQLGGVPLLIPAAWFMMLPPSWAIAYRFRHSPILFATVSGAALTAWDLLLDPQMVQWQLWVWDQPGHYFGIPWLNFGGWFLTAFLLTLLLRPFQLPQKPLLLVYTITWFLETVGLLFFWQLLGPAFIGGSLMAVFVWFGWQYRPQKR